MKNSFLILLAISILAGCSGKKENPDTSNFETAGQLLEAMKSENDSTWYQHFTFKQHTEFFDTVGQSDSALWYEAVSFPYLFRIDRDIERGNYTIYRSDSTYHILADTINSATADPGAHLVFKGGLYFISLDETKEKLEKYGLREIAGFANALYRKLSIYHPRILATEIGPFTTVEVERMVRLIKKRK
jgi:hypothetical protein